MDDVTAIGLLIGLFILLGMGAILALILVMVEGVLDACYKDNG